MYKQNQMKVVIKINKVENFYHTQRQPQQHTNEMTKT